MVNLQVAAGALVAVILLVWVVHLLLERDGEEAARKTSNQVVGTSVGSIMALTAAATEGLHMLAELPGLVIALLGIGAIFKGVSWEMFAAVAMSAYIVMAALRGE